MMEADNVIKSVLKKTNGVIVNKEKGRNVTFSNVVKLFTSNGHKSNAWKLKCVEISIVDKSHNQGPDRHKLLNEECKAEDFLVHKVVYNEEVIPDDEIELTENVAYESVVFPPQNKDDDLDFVVHKVTEHEDDMHNDSDVEDDSQTITDVVTEPFSKLSVENILEHDKIFALSDQNILNGADVTLSTVNLINLVDLSENSSNNTSKITKDLVLSPPLQELSLEKLVQAHSDNVLCDLDISPLNSIQETDSDSDVSSEDTMIMMTSEECQKNEKHIQQSYLQFQTLKEKKLIDIIDMVDFENNENEVNVEEKVESTVEKPDCEAKLEKTLTNKAANDIVHHEVNSEQNSKPKEACGEIPSTVNQKQSQQSDKSSDSSTLNNALIAQNCSILDKNLACVEIPKDVREWKITPTSSNRQSGSHSSQPEDVQYQNGYHEEETEIQRPDELENFVHESTERVERIRRRYNVCEREPRFRVKHASLRGIRPRFGSTAEILQLMQNKNQPSMISYDSSRHHMSWPCFDESLDRYRAESAEREQKKLEHYMNQRLSNEYGTPFQDIPPDLFLNSDVCDYCSISSCPSMSMHDREGPEGASPPRSLTEHVGEQDYNESEGIVYYSMKV